MGSIRVAVGPYRPSGSGMASYARHLVQAILAAGDEVTFIGFGLRETARTQPVPGLNTIDLGIDPKWLDALGPQVAFGIIRKRLGRVLENLRPEVLHVPYPSAFPNDLGIPGVVTGWAFGDPIQLVRSGLSGFSGPKRWISPIGYLLYYSSDRAGYKNADSSIFTTRAGLDYWRNQCKISSYVPCPVGPDRGYWSGQIEQSSGEKLGLLVGERDLSRPRNHVRDLLKACLQLTTTERHSVRVVLVGRGGEHFTELQSMCRAAGVEVLISPYLPREDFYNELLRADVCIQLRDILDQGGYMALEAMAEGRVVIASDSPGFSDFVLDGETGIVVKPSDLEAIRDCLSRLIGDRKKARDLGQRAKLHIQNSHSYKTVGNILNSKYLEVLNS
jgi:glycosyltransferase involved in cell wall biosynthesis